ncbi:hypothetical protein D8S78_02125 [Natrialba swarupiae]|nr:hypothetical protein [Natrialba swarupiae]
MHTHQTPTPPDKSVAVSPTYEPSDCAYLSGYRFSRRQPTTAVSRRQPTTGVVSRDVNPFGVDVDRYRRSLEDVLEQPILGQNGIDDRPTGVGQFVPSSQLATKDSRSCLRW